MLSGEQLVQLISILSMFIISYLKYRADNMKAVKINEKEHKKLFKEMDSLKNSLLGITTYIKTEEGLFDGITKAGVDVIHSNIGLDSKVIRLMNATVANVRSFAVRYNKSAYRKTKTDIEEFMDIEVKAINVELDDLADDMFGSKVIDGDEIPYSIYSDRYSEMDFIIKTMVRTLIKNGLSSKDYNKLFVSFTKELLIEQTNVWRKWSKQ